MDVYESVTIVDFVFLITGKKLRDRESTVSLRLCVAASAPSTMRTTTGTMVGSGEIINLFNVYAPQSTSTKYSLWRKITDHISRAVGMAVVVGDFNVVRCADERRNSSFKPGSSMFGQMA